MDESEIPIEIHTLKLKDWLISRRIVPKNIQTYIKIIRNKINNALKDMPSNEQLLNLLSGASINYYHCKEIVEILKQTEKDSKSVFGTYGSQRMKDWLEIISLYEKENTYLAETAQIYIRNIAYEIPALRKQMSKLEQQSEESQKRVQDLAKPETQLLNEHAALLQQLGVKGDNLRDEFLCVLEKLPDLYTHSIRNLASLQEAIDMYKDFNGNAMCLPILRHLIEFGNTTVYQYIHREAPLGVEENPIKLNLTENIDESPVIDFGGDDNGGGTSSSISAEIIDFADLNIDCSSADIADEIGDNIDWGIESTPCDAVEINFDIPIEEYGIVVEGVGMDGGIAKGDQAYTILDSPTYRERFIDELYELESFLKMRRYEVNQIENSSSIILSLIGDSISTHDVASIRKMLTIVEEILEEVSSENTRHLFQLKHSPKYADLLVGKLKRMTKAVEKIRATKKTLKEQSVQLKKERSDLNPILEDLIHRTKILQKQIEMDISKRYKNRVVNLLGGISAF